MKRHKICLVRQCGGQKGPNIPKEREVRKGQIVGKWDKLILILKCDLNLDLRVLLTSWTFEPSSVGPPIIIIGVVVVGGASTITDPSKFSPSKSSKPNLFGS